MHDKPSTSIGFSISGKLPFSSSMLPAEPTATSVPSVSRKLIKNNVSNSGKKLIRNTPMIFSFRAMGLKE